MVRFWLSAVLALSTATVALAVPSTLNYQGQLFLNGSPTSGGVSIVFRMYDAATGGTELWTETDIVTVTGGLFSTTLGDGAALPVTLFSAQVPWLEMEVNGTVMTPRTQFASVPYALDAAHAGVADVALSAPAPSDLWSTDGTNVWRGTGRVGVGTATPDQQLSVGGMFSILPTTWTAPSVRGMFLYHAGVGGGNIYAYDYAAGHADPIGIAGSKVVLGAYDAFGAFGPKVTVLGSGYTGIGTEAPDYSLDVRTSDPLHGLNWQTTSGTEVGSYVRFGSNNARGALFIGNANVGGSLGSDEAAILQTTGGWQWNRQLNVMGNVGINTNNATSTLTVNGNAEVGGNLNVAGTKCRTVESAQYGRLYFNAVESGTADFTDRGEGALVNGRCHIALDPRWLAGVTIDDAHPMQVTITAYYGPHGGQGYVERTKTGFTLIDPSGSNAAFGWKVEARQKGYEDIYLNYLNRVEPTAAK